MKINIGAIICLFYVIALFTILMMLTDKLIENPGLWIFVALIVGVAAIISLIKLGNLK